MLAAILAMSSVLFGAEPSKPLSEDETQKLLDDAIGYACVYNYEKAEEICDRVLAKTQNPKIQGRAHWVKAEAYVHFDLEYRTDRLRHKLAKEREDVERLAPELLLDDLAGIEAILPLYATEKPDVAVILDETRRELLTSERPEKRAAPVEDPLLTAPVVAYKLGQVYRHAAYLTSETVPDKSREYRAQALRMYKKALELEPDNYDFALQYDIAAIDMGLLEEAEASAKRLAAKFEHLLRYSPISDHGPACHYAMAVSYAHQCKGKELIQSWAKTPTADAWVYFEDASNRADRATSCTEKVRIWQEFVERIERGEIKTPGTYLRALTGAYYRLGHFQAKQDLWTESLATYMKLSAISPHYAELHCNLGIVLWQLASKEEDPTKAKTLFEQARKEFELQQQYNWHFEGARAARKYIRHLMIGTIRGDVQGAFTDDELTRQTYLLVEDPADRADYWSLFGKQWQRDMAEELPEKRKAIRGYAVEGYLIGLRGLLEYDLPATPSTRLFESCKRLRDVDQKAKVAAQAVLVQFRENLTKAIVALYAEEPDAFTELRKKALTYLRNAEAAEILVAAAQEYRQNPKMPIPVLESMGKWPVTSATVGEDRIQEYIREQPGSGPAVKSTKEPAEGVEDRARGARGSQPAKPLSEDEMQKLLDDAIGYACVYNYEKAEEICDRVLAATQNPKLQARAHWTKAVGYAVFEVEYCTDRLKDKLAAADKMVHLLNPQLFGEILAGVEGVLPFNVTEKPDIEGILKEMRRDWLRPIPAGQPSAVPDEDRTTDPISIYRLAHAYWKAARLTSGTLEAKSGEYRAQALRMFKKAMEMRPDIFEFAAYYDTVACEMGHEEEARRIAKRLLETFDDKTRFPMTCDRSPFCHYAAVLSRSDPYKAAEMVQKRAKEPSADAWTCFEDASYRQEWATSDTEKVRIWAELVGRVEKGEVKTPGPQMQVLVRAYYGLAHAQTEQGLWEESLATCQKLAAISPHYIRLHTTKGIVLWNIAAKTQDQPKARELFDQARKEFELQLQYDWHREGTKTARQWLDYLAIVQRPQPPSTRP